MGCSAVHRDLYIVLIKIWHEVDSQLFFHYVFTICDITVANL